MSEPYPIGLRLDGLRVLVVGGGAVATRRLPALLAAGADVVLVSPALTPALHDLADAGRIAGYRDGSNRPMWTAHGWCRSRWTTPRPRSRSARRRRSGGFSAYARTTATPRQPGRPR